MFESSPSQRAGPIQRSCIANDIGILYVAACNSYHRLMDAWQYCDYDLSDPVIRCQRFSSVVSYHCCGQTTRLERIVELPRERYALIAIRPGDQDVGAGVFLKLATSKIGVENRLFDTAEETELCREHNPHCGGCPSIGLCATKTR